MSITIISAGKGFSARYDPIIPIRHICLWYKLSDKQSQNTDARYATYQIFVFLSVEQINHSDRGQWRSESVKRCLPTRACASGAMQASKWGSYESHTLRDQAYAGWSNYFTLWRRLKGSPCPCALLRSSSLSSSSLLCLPPTTSPVANHHYRIYWPSQPILFLTTQTRSRHGVHMEGHCFEDWSAGNRRADKMMEALANLYACLCACFCCCCGGRDGGGGHDKGAQCLSTFLKK